MADRRSSPRTGSKRKFDEPPSEAPSRPNYRSVPPPLSDFELAKQRAEQIAARLCGDESKRSRVSSSDDHNDISVGSNVSHGYAHSVPDVDYQTKKLDVPNSKVGLVIGKGGETIRNLQLQSGAKIQVMRDAESDHSAPMRQIDISGTSEQISRAQQMIREVIGDAALGSSSHGGSGGVDQIQIRVPNNKVGLIIGKGGETIKSLQQNSGARIQVQHDRETEPGATERVVTLSGTKQQIDNATELIKEVIGERSRGGYQQGGYRSQQAWGAQSGYGYNQQQGYQQEYGNYSWDQQQQAPYDYYQNQSSGQQSENDGNYNYQEGYYYDQQGYAYQQGYDQSGYNQQGYNQEEYAAGSGGGYNYEYDPSYSYDQSGQYPPAAEGAEEEGNGPPGDYPAQKQRTSPPASSAQPAET